jgi:hypothetical protein
MFRVTRYHGIIDLDFEHHGEVFAVLIDLLVPIDHWLKAALHSFHAAVSQKLVVIG